MREVGIRRAGIVVKNVTNMMMALTMAAAVFTYELQSAKLDMEGLTNRSRGIAPIRGSRRLFLVLAGASCALA